MKWIPIKNPIDLPAVGEFKFLTTQEGDKPRQVVLGYYSGNTIENKPIFKYVGSHQKIVVPVLAHMDLPLPWNG